MLGAVVALSAMAVKPTEGQIDSVNAALAATFYESVRPALNNIQAQGLPLDREIFARYLTQALKGDTLMFTPETANAYMTQYMRNLHQADTVSMAEQAQWLGQMAKEPGAEVLDDGVIVVVVTKGEGVSPQPTDKVKVRYRGTLSDGTAFDDSRGEVVEFGLNQVIPGFSEGLQHMQPGGHYRLYIPSDKAYGAQGIPGVIPGNAALCFDITLDEVIKK